MERTNLYNKIRPLLFKTDSERINAAAEAYLHASRFLPSLLFPLVERRFEDQSLHSSALGMKADNPVGLAAGFDKNAVLIRPAYGMGFGFSEVGTVTLKPQRGNEKPRLFRYPDQKSVQNRMGFNGCGMEQFSKNLEKQTPFPMPVGINLGKNKATPKEEALGDYIELAKRLSGYASYIALNLSSPNTPGLRDLENAEFVTDAVGAIRHVTKKPIFVKISPDSTPEHVIEVGHAVADAGGRGIIATNTTRDFTLVSNSKLDGGISGVALRRYSRKTLSILSNEMDGRIMIISVGGIDSAEEAYMRILNGASLVQLYTAMIFEGPNIANSINKGLANLLRRDGYDKVGQAVGAGIGR
ncbi:MAG: quinone-dependent dihydroorotate dehydrogenase [Candidatus Micrarchaeia archaeon]